MLWVSVLRCISISLTNTSWLRPPSLPPNFPVLRTGMSSSLWQSPPDHSMTYRGSYRHLKFPKDFLKISNWTWWINVQVISGEASLHGFQNLTFIFLTVLNILIVTKVQHLWFYVVIWYKKVESWNKVLAYNKNLLYYIFLKN